MEARSPFSARFQPIEISCPQISVRWSPLRNRRILTLWRLTRCCVRCRREPKAQSWPRSYIRWSGWLDHFCTAAKLLRGIGAAGAKTASCEGDVFREIILTSRGSQRGCGRLCESREPKRRHSAWDVRLGPREVLYQERKRWLTRQTRSR
jgi:hypothetical protein